MAPLISKIISGFGFAKVKPKILAAGGLINISDGYTYHIFTSPGTFTLTGTVEEVEYLIVAGGGGRAFPGGGGGAGGLRTGLTSVSNNPGIYPITVGSGGGSSTPNGNYGSPSSAFSITSSGGGGGGVFGPPFLSNPANGTPGNPGGSGGGGGGSYVFGGSPAFTFRTGGSGGGGNSPPVSPPQGNGGAPGGPVTPSNRTGYNGGGGGAGGFGSVRDGGSGSSTPPSFPLSAIGPLMPASWLSLITNYGFARGGNGSTPNTIPSASVPSNISNTGYGGNAPVLPGAGSSGIVIIRYEN